MKFEELERKLERFRKKKIKERIKIEEKVFDRFTLLALYELANKGYIDLLYGVIKTGKESAVFLGKKDEKNLAVKIHKVWAYDFKNILPYIEGDYRFQKLRKSRREMINLWVQKEFKNLKLAVESGIKAPKPIAYRSNILIMEFIGSNSSPAPMLKHYKLEKRESDRIYSTILEYIRKLYHRARLVHADLSEYNILISEKEPILIDFSQAVPTSHPLANEFLVRDIRNICRFFKKDMKEAVRKVVGWSI